MYRSKLMTNGHVIHRRLFRAVSPSGGFKSGHPCAVNYSSSRKTEREECRDASTVVIGGGVTGTSIAYHLAKQGEKNVVLLEKGEVAAGSTRYAAGLTTSYHSNPSVKKIHYYSLNMYAKLEAETGQRVSFQQPGSIRIATTPAYEEDFKFQMAKAGLQKAPQILLTPKQVKEKAPLIREDKVVKGLYTPMDGHVDPSLLTLAIAKGAKKYGARIEERTAVSSLNLREDGRWEVGTTQGSILADRVVNAAGMWAKEVGKLAGLDLPLVPLEHQYLVTSPVPEIQSLEEEFPVLRIMEASCYVRQEMDGFLVGAFESKDTVKLRDEWTRHPVPSDLTKDLFPADLERMKPNLEIVKEVIPSVASATIDTVVNGPMPFGPDSLPLVGPSLLPNLWLAVGFGESGITQGGGAGKFLADWIHEGEPPYDLMGMDPGRFGDWTSEEYVLARARESYGMKYGLSYEQGSAGRPTRVSTAYDKQLARGAFMVIDGNWDHPLFHIKEGETLPSELSFWRTSLHDIIKREWNAVRTSAGVIDLTPFAKITLEGPEAAAFIDQVSTSRVPAIGKCTMSYLLTPKGKVCAELSITQTDPDRFLLVTAPDSEIHDFRYLKELIREKNWKVEARNVSEEVSILSVAGPASRDLLAHIHPRFKEKFPFFTFNKMNIGGIEVGALRLSFTGELGWELYHPWKDTGKLYDIILEAGSKIDGGLVDFGSFALDILRFEKGLRFYGKEMNHDTNVVEAGLMDFVDLRKKDFIGKAAVERILREGIDRQLVLIKIDPKSRADPQGGESIWKDGKVVGNTTSGCFSFKLNQPLAFAYLPPFMALPGAKVEVELMGDRYGAEVLAKPPDNMYKEKKQ